MGYCLPWHWQLGMGVDSHAWPQIDWPGNSIRDCAATAFATELAYWTTDYDAHQLAAGCCVASVLLAPSTGL